MATLSIARDDSDAAKGNCNCRRQKELPMEIHGSVPFQFFV
jgi:hypothetical protein